MASARSRKVAHAPVPLRRGQSIPCFLECLNGATEKSSFQGWPVPLVLLSFFHELLQNILLAEHVAPHVAAQRCVMAFVLHLAMVDDTEANEALELIKGPLKVHVVWNQIPKAGPKCMVKMIA